MSVAVVEIYSGMNRSITWLLMLWQLKESWSWWRHRMETFSALLAICAGNSPVPGEFPAQRPVTRSFDVFFDLHPNKRLSKHWGGWWFETLSCPLWRHRNVLSIWCVIKYLCLWWRRILTVGAQCRKRVWNRNIHFPVSSKQFSA